MSRGRHTPRAQSPRGTSNASKLLFAGVGSTWLARYVIDHRCHVRHTAFSTGDDITHRRDVEVFALHYVIRHGDRVRRAITVCELHTRYPIWHHRRHPQSTRRTRRRRSFTFYTDTDESFFFDYCGPSANRAAASTDSQFYDAVPTFRVVGDVDFGSPHHRCENRARRRGERANSCDTRQPLWVMRENRDTSSLALSMMHTPVTPSRSQRCRHEQADNCGCDDKHQ